jgi:hypothetical protein
VHYLVADLVKFIPPQTGINKGSYTQKKKLRMVLEGKIRLRFTGTQMAMGAARRFLSLSGK